MSNPPPNSQETKRIAGVIVTHGHLAGELLAAAEMIIGPISFMTAYAGVEAISPQTIAGMPALRAAFKLVSMLRSTAG